jgi:succinate dehydrogenase hydrophobic anchor subunit
MDYISLFTAIARVFILIPLVMFFLKQSGIHAKNGDVGRVRRITIIIVVFLVLMFGNLVWVNMTSALDDLHQGITAARWVALLSSTGLAGALWYCYALFRRIQAP